MGMKGKTLNDIRRQIDIIDKRIIELLNKRMEMVLKTRMHKEHIFDPEREQEVLENVRRLSHHLIRPDFSERLYRLILKESRSLQKKAFNFEGNIESQIEVKK